MNREKLVAALKAAAWGLAALVGAGEAARIVRSIAAELIDSEWQGPGSR